MKSVVLDTPPMGRHRWKLGVYYQRLSIKSDEITILYKPAHGLLGGVKPHTFYDVYVEIGSFNRDVDDYPLNVTVRQFPPDLPESDLILDALARYTIGFRGRLLKKERQGLEKAYNEMLQNAGWRTVRW